jgi:hypothetical protein
MSGRPFCFNEEMSAALAQLTVELERRAAEKIANGLARDRAYADAYFELEMLALDAQRERALQEIRELGT